MPDAPLVWLPFAPRELTDPPTGLRYEVVDPTRHVPSSVDEVAFYVTPYNMGPEIGDVLPRMSGLEVVQTLSAGVDSVRSRVPEGVTLCSGRGIHDSSTAELALTLVLASLRGVPDFVRARTAASGRGLGDRHWPTSTSCSSATARSGRRSSVGSWPSRPP